MIDCPLCDHANIEGEDFCQECGQPLSDSHLKELPTEVERHLVRDRLDVLQPRQPITVAPETAVRDVLGMLIDRGIGCVLVVDGETLVGVFTERDALRRLAGRLDELGDLPVSQFMTASPQTLDVEAKVAFAVRSMDQGGYRHLPIVDDQNRPTGVISVRDILQYLTERMHR